MVCPLEVRMTRRGVNLFRIPAGLPGANIAVLRLHYSADDNLTPEIIAKMRAGYSSEGRWRQEMELDAHALEGELLYPEYSPERNDCAPFDVSDASKWTIWHACDPHMRTPLAFLWWAANADDEHAICGELWTPDRRYTPFECADTIKWLESDSLDKPAAWDWCRGKRLHVYYRVMDTHGSAANSEEGTDFFQTLARHDLTYYPAKKGQQILAAARDWIGTRLLPERLSDGTNYVRLRVFDTLQYTRFQLSNVRYPSGVVERQRQERPETYTKHQLDCMHYIAGEEPSFVLQRITTTPRRGPGGFTPLNPATGY